MEEKKGRRLVSRGDSKEDEVQEEAPPGVRARITRSPTCGTIIVKFFVSISDSMLGSDIIWL